MYCDKHCNRSNHPNKITVDKSLPAVDKLCIRDVAGGASKPEPDGGKDGGPDSGAQPREERERTKRHLCDPGGD